MNYVVNEEDIEEYSYRSEESDPNQNMLDAPTVATSIQD